MSFKMAKNVTQNYSKYKIFVNTVDLAVKYNKFHL